MLLARSLRHAGLCLAACGSVANAIAAQDPSDQGRRVAALGAGVEVSVGEVEELLLLRHGMSKDGLDILEMRVKIDLLDKLADAAGLSIAEEAITRYWSELDEKGRATGDPRGLQAEIERRGLTVEQFREYIRRLIVQERLARRDLGIADTDPITFDQQEIWLSQEIAYRGLEKASPPFDEGFVARCGDVSIEPAVFAEFLRLGLPREQVEEACWHLLLYKGIRKRMPDISSDALARGIDVEIERRRAEHRREHPAITFEQRIGAVGRTLESLRDDPSVHIAVLSRMWIDRTVGDEGIRDAYEAERAMFDGRFGRSVHTHMLFKVAGRFVNELNKRTFATAEKELEALRRRIVTVEDFEALASQFSEEPTTRERGGEIGWVHRADGRVPAQVREAVFDFSDANESVRAGGQMLDTVQLDTGCALLWISGIRAGPDWDVMAENVHEELRRRFVIDVMPTGAMKILLFDDGETGGDSSDSKGDPLR